MKPSVELFVGAWASKSREKKHVYDCRNDLGTKLESYSKLYSVRGNNTAPHSCGGTSRLTLTFFLTVVSLSLVWDVCLLSG